MLVHPASFSNPFTRQIEIFPPPFRKKDPRSDPINQTSTDGSKTKIRGFIRQSREINDRKYQSIASTTATPGRKAEQRKNHPCRYPHPTNPSSLPILLFLVSCYRKKIKREGIGWGRDTTLNVPATPCGVTHLRT